MKYDYKTLEKQMKSLPEDLQYAMSSVEVSKTIQDIAKKHNLLLDKASDLADETFYIILGLTKTKDFVDVITNKLNIKKLEAIDIAKDINIEVFDKIKDSLQKIQSQNPEDSDSEIEDTSTRSTPIQPPAPSTLTPPPPPATQPITPTPPPNPDLSSLEKVGNFTIEKPRMPSHSPQYQDQNLDRDKVLEHMENPPTKTPPVSFVDHLLAKPVSSVNEVKTQEPKKGPEKEPRKFTADPYREPIE